MINLTKFLKLNKPNPTDAYDINVVNSNMDKLDKGVEDLNTKYSELKNGFDRIELTDTKVKITTENDKLLSVVLREIKSNASSLLEKINTNKNNIGTLTGLKTKEKNNIVGSVNELVDNIDLLTRENILTGSTDEWVVKTFNRERYSDRVTIFSTAIIPANKIDKGKKYVLSFVMEVSDLVYDSGATYHTQAFANGSDTTRNAWSRYGYFDSANKTIKVTFPIDFDRVLRMSGTEIEYFGAISIVFRMIRSGTIKFKELKLEEGEIATPWCLSTSEIVSINKNINALTRKITSNNAELNRLNTEFRITNGGA